MFLTFHLPRGHGTYLKANETYRYFSLLIASDEFLRIHFLRLESQSDLRQRYFQKSYLNDRRQKAQTRHISLYDENSARFRRNDCKGRGSRFYGRTGYCQQEFQCSVRTQSARRPRVGHRCCHRCHYQARIQVLSNRFSAGRERKRLILKENNDYNSTVSTMKRTLFIYTIFLLAISCHKNDDTDNANEPTIYYVKYEASGNGSYSYVDKTIVATGDGDRTFTGTARSWSETFGPVSKGFRAEITASGRGGIPRVAIYVCRGKEPFALKQTGNGSASYTIDF